MRPKVLLENAKRVLGLDKEYYHGVIALNSELSLGVREAFMGKIKIGTASRTDRSLVESRRPIRSQRQASGRPVGEGLRE